MWQPRPGEPTVAEVGEDALVTAIVARLRTGPEPEQHLGDAARVLVGPGDDAAVLSLGGDVVLSTDTLVEGVDFRRDWSAPYDLGRKAAVQVLADVEAMGAVPVGLLVALVIPGTTPLSWCEQLADGLAREATEAAVQILGGDVADGPCLMLTGTSTGVLMGEAPATTRAGAQPGDVVALSGPVGASAAGLALLLSGRTGGGGLPAPTLRAVDRALAVHRAPTIDHSAGARARTGGARALIDVSDGLVRDAGRIAAASKVVIDLDPSALTPDADLQLVADLLVQDAAEWVLTSGEEHAMLACFAADSELPAGFRRVGQVGQVGDDGAAVLIGGRPRTGAGGWTHYGRRP